MILNLTQHLKSLATALSMSLLMTGCAQSNPPEGDYLSPEPGYNDPLTNFDPPRDLVIERSYVMTSGGQKSGSITSVRKVDQDRRLPLIRDDVESAIQIGRDSLVRTDETVWIGPDGLQEYTGVFKDDGKDDVNINAVLKDGVLNFDAQDKEGGAVHRQEFVPGTDYHWSTVYLDIRNRELVQGQRYKRKILDVSFARLMDVEEAYLGMKEFRLGDQVFDCHVLWFDYGHLNGTVWVAEDELGFFLVYEKATATEGDFELVLSNYTINDDQAD